MGFDTWIGLGAASLLAVAAVAELLFLRWQSNVWWIASTSARATGLAALATGIGLSSVAAGGWSPHVPSLMGLGLALVQVLVYWVLVRRHEVLPAGLAVDLIALVLILVSIFAVPSGSVARHCAQQAWLAYVQWILFLFGAGSTVALGCLYMVWEVQTLWAYLRSEPAPPAYPGAHCAGDGLASVAIVGLGSGLCAGLWWAWRTTGRLISGDPREMWMAVTALMVFLVLQKRRWSAVAAALAALCAIWGVMHVLDLGYLVN